MRKGLFWFTQDLRLHDNPALVRACMSVDQLLCVYNFEPTWCQTKQSMSQSPGKARQGFLEESVNNLAESLNSLGQQLIVLRKPHYDAINELISACEPTDIFQSEQIGWYERAIWTKLARNFPNTRFHSISSYTLFDQQTLPFSLEEMPSGFGAFRRQLETRPPLAPLREITYLPPTPDMQNLPVQNPSKPVTSCETTYRPFTGGEKAGLAHLRQYFHSDAPSSYKETRNALDGWSSSCKFSAWLSTGCLSVRKVLSELSRYERDHVANESTYWIFFELLWREYFQWYALRQGKKLFRFSGVTGKKPLTSYYGERLAKWKHGNTPYPIVNACMNELSQTGYLSNRGRQISASCLINELSIDWRFGAAHFENMLIDYDVATNWGNWQYLAGVGAATVTHRHFNLAKQTAQFDPSGEYISKWTEGTPALALDSVDAADWPIQ